MRPSRPASERLGVFDPVESFELEPLDGLYDVSFWREFDPFWLRRVDDRPVDRARTAALAVWNAPVRCGGPGRGPARSGVPWHRVDGSFRVERVHLAHRRGTWSDPFPSERVPLPAEVRRYGDPRPGSWGDFQTFIVDPDQGVYWELSSFAPSGLYIDGTGVHVPFPPHLRWRCENFQRWRLDRDWTTNSGSIVAGGFPMLPMVPTVEELDRGAGGLAKVLHLSLPFYNGERLANDARKTDGRVSNFPLYAGDRLLLNRAVSAKLRATLELTRHDEALLWCLERYGVVLDDRSTGLSGVQSVEAFTTAAGPSIRMPQDPRVDVTVDRQIPLAGFDVIEATFRN